MPRFVLQLLVENAIKHGLSKLLDTGYIDVNAYRSDDNLVKIDIKDSAGQFCEDKASNSEGHGLKLVDDLIKAQFNSKQFGVSVQCQQDEYTIVTITLPFETENDGATDSLIGG